MDKKVLFVDDQEDILDLIKIKLQNEEYDKYFALNVKEALEILENQKIDVVITDIVMPDVDGHDFLDILKNKYPKTVRVILSGFSQVNSIISAINNEDVYRYITKPWKIDEAGKEIIRGAVRYSDFLKQDNMISLNKLAEVLNKLEVNFEIKDSDSQRDEQQTIKLNDNKILIIK